MKIKIIDNLPPEACAMAQALYSRSPKSIDDHLEKIEEVGAEKFMSTYYVGYGHKSIGDCGTTTIFIEGVSMLAAKAIQDWQLYNGQEASTRYMDFGNQEGEWFDFYRENLPKVQVHLMQKYPTMIEKGIKARAFDIMRAFLPAGAKTNLSWHTNLRQATDHLLLLIHHPLEEVRNIAKQIWAMLKEKYPASFSHKIRNDQEAYRSEWVSAHTYMPEAKIIGEFNAMWVGHPVDSTHPVFVNRPKYTELPALVEMHGSFVFKFKLDFGSFRDFARHRNGIIWVTQLTTERGFEQWYLDQLPDEVRIAALTKLLQFDSKDPYHIPMGYRVGVICSFPLNAAVYMAELRSSVAVHPTLRVIAQKIAQTIRDEHGILLHADMSEDEPLKIFEVRAKHDIMEKP